MSGPDLNGFNAEDSYWRDLVRERGPVESLELVMSRLVASVRRARGQESGYLRCTGDLVACVTEQVGQGRVTAETPSPLPPTDDDTIGDLIVRLEVHREDTYLSRGLDSRLAEDLRRAIILLRAQVQAG